MFDTPEGEEVKFDAMMCTLCDSFDWISGRKKNDDVNFRVQCDNCWYVYATLFQSESLEYRLASAFSHGHIWQESFTAYGMESESGELVVSTDPKLLLEWFVS